MLTSSFMSTNTHEFREEYLDNAMHYGSYVGIDPLFAPRSIATGHHYSYKCISSDFYLSLPGCVGRDD